MDQGIWGDETFSSPILWKSWFLLPYRLTHAVQLQSFSFHMFYRTNPCRAYLNQIRAVDSEICLRCAERDDIFHFLFECQCVKEFWDNLATWMDGRQGVQPFPDDLTEEEFLLGVVERDGNFSLFNFIILCAKFYVYKTTTFALGDPSLIQFLLEQKIGFQLSGYVVWLTTPSIKGSKDGFLFTMTSKA